MKQWQKWTVLMLCCLICFAIAMPFAWAKPLQEDDLKYEEPTPLPSPSLLGVTVRVIFSLILVVGLAYLVSKCFGHKMMGLTQGNNLRLLETMPLGTNKAIYIVEIVDEVFVLSVTDHNINILTKIEDPDVIAALREKGQAKPVKGSFDSYIQTFREKFNRGDHSDLSSSMLLQEQVERLRKLTQRTARSNRIRSRNRTRESGGEDDEQQG